MKMKNSKTSIANLNPVFTKPLQELDLLHTQLMGNQAIVTSTNHGKHWGKFKKHRRPVGWENMTEKQVQSYSNSKHYTNEALDFRRRNPDKDSDLNYYDDLTESEQRYFMVEIYKCFPDELFDITFSRLCIHCEWDPKLKTKPLENDESRTDDDLDPREANVTPSTKGKAKPIELPKLPIWKKSGFKRIAGGIVTGAGTILTLLPEYSGVGQIVMWAGGALGLTGVGAGMMKNRKKDEVTKIDTIKILRWIADLLIKLFSKK